MSQTTPTLHPSDAECAALQKQAGYLVKNLDHGLPMTEAQAIALATEHAQCTGGRWGVFKLCAVAEPGESAVRAVDPVVERARAVMAGALPASSV